MPFSENGGVVSRFLKFLGECPLRPVKSILWFVLGVVSIKAVGVAVLAGENGRPAGTTNGVPTKTVVEQRSLGSQAIEVGRQVVGLGEILQPGFVGSDGLDGMVIGKDEKDVG